MFLKFDLSADDNQYGVSAPSAVLQITSFTVNIKNQTASAEADIWLSEENFDAGKQPLQSVQLSVGPAQAARPAKYAHKVDDGNKPVYENGEPVLEVSVPAQPAVPGFGQLMSKFATEYTAIAAELYAQIKDAHPMLANSTLVKT